MSHPDTVHIIGSKSLGGAERFFIRLLKALKEHGEFPAAIVRKGSEVAENVPEGVFLTELPLRTVWDPLSKIEVRRALKRMAPGIVQTYMGRATRLTHIPAKSGMVHVVRIGGFYKLDGYRHAHAWIGNTRGVCDHLIRGGFPGDRVFCIGNFVEPPSVYDKQAILDARSALGIPEDALVILAMGRFVPVKGHIYLLEAFSRLPRSVAGRDLWLCMAGDGPLRGRLEAAADALGVMERVAWPGWVAGPDLFYQMADVVAFPSLEGEALGNVIPEAWNAGRPVVTSRCMGAREITVHGGNAWQVECGDAKGLADGIMTVLRDAELRRQLVERGREEAARAFSKERVVQRYLDLYRELMGRAGRAGA